MGLSLSVDENDDNDVKGCLSLFSFLFRNSSNSDKSNSFVEPGADDSLITESPNPNREVELSRELFTAVYFGKKKSLISILNKNKNFEFSNIVWGKGLSALHVAALRGHFGCVKLLCSMCKFDMDKLDEVGVMV